MSAIRQIVLDTETTGLDFTIGNRMIELGCIEVVNRRLTGKSFHTYLNPQFEVEKGAYEIHKLSDEFLSDKPLFSSIAEEFVDFIRGAELIIHNAPFDVGFLNNELRLDGNRFGLISDICPAIIDTLVMARHMYPGQRNSLDALCKRFGVDNTERTAHGALIDAELLAEVYLFMTGGQTGLELGGMSNDFSGGQTAETIRRLSRSMDLPILSATPDELEKHNAYLELLSKKSNRSCIW